MSGTADSAETMKKAVLVAVNVLNVSGVEAAGLSAPPQQSRVEYYVIRKATAFQHSLAPLGQCHGICLDFDANREVAKDSILIYPGQKIGIPLG